ncbi:hypothetical protein EXIGLDRAFT_670637 [Exidia glandulosa HHB12029]|uniref:GDP/GTP exchange factor Sec2 N-terminal domain-containing protein n=1 Tax=Exidia glandulosa HHB12029 TaxID=1314781 RepID=A0A165KWE8_EXIGL|nr:hypothetical protein EXIGLDRAFT_670637 [Exidia glandulosa HHB12029]
MATVDGANEDADAQEMVITSLRAQVSDLFTQVSQLNGKLVKSYDRISDLEDSLHDESSRLRATSLKVAQLELERTQHLSDLSAGLLVEKAQVTTELNRLMERATEEAARRGQAETARLTIEKELGDLSASLFEQANRMVREANLLRAQSDRRANEAEDALRTAEEAVGGMQIQMQTLRSEKDRADSEMQDLRALVDKGKWVERPHAVQSPLVALKLISSHVPYEEFLLFVAHLRSLRPQPVPAMSTLLPLPFLARIVMEDSDPTLRLDLAPALNWLSRRAVTAAVHAGALNVEPITTGAYLRETSTMNAPAALSSITCAMCGKQVHPNSATHPKLSHKPSNSGSWNMFNLVPSQPSTPPSASSSAAPTLPPRPSSRNSHPIYQSQIFVFRVTAASTPGTSGQKSTTYALCGTGWCLPRLRATCALWHFIRTGVVERIWEEEMPVQALPAPNTPSRPARTNSGSISNFAGAIAGSIVNGVNTVSGVRKGTEAPPVPPRRQSGGRVGSLLGMLGTGNNKAPPPPSKTSNTPLTPTREKPSLMSRSPPSGTRSPTNGTVASRRRASNASNGSIKSPVRSPATPPVTTHRRPVSATKEKTDQNIEHHIDEHGPPAEVLFELDAGADGPKSPGVPSPTKEAPILAPALPPRVRPVSASVVPLPMSPPTTPEPVLPQTAPAPAPAAQPVAAVPPSLVNGRASPAVNGRASPALNGNGSGRNSPAPPPVPKRAAGRKRAATIMREAAQTPPPAAEKKVEAAIAEEAEESAPAAPAEPAPEGAAEATVSTVDTVTLPASDAGAAAPAPAVSEPSPKPEEASSSSPTAEPQVIVAEPTVDAEQSAPANVPVHLTPSPAPIIETSAAPEPEPDSARLSPVPPPPTQTLSVDNLVAPTPTSPGPESPLFPAASPVYETEPEVVVVEEKKDDVPAPASELDGGAQYVGETTWEERTWKEIVVLREAMFWARIGCVR